MNRNDEINRIVSGSSSGTLFEKIDKAREKLNEEQGELEKTEIVMKGHRHKLSDVDEFDDIIDVEVLHELGRANLKFPMFKSENEGYGVLLEEVDETYEELERIYRNMESLKAYTRTSKELPHKINDQEKETINSIYQYAKLAIKELIQVMAMCIKYKQSFSK